MYNPFSLEGKTILVTGASSGIGRTTAIECSKLGATLVLTGRNEEALLETKVQLQGDGHVHLLADLSDEKNCEELVKQLPVLDGCVGNAGMGKMLATIDIVRKPRMNQGKIFTMEKFAFSSLPSFWLARASLRLILS